MLWYGSLEQLALIKPKTLTDLAKPTLDHTMCIMTKTETPFSVCIYNVSEDIYVSKSLESSGIWEPAITSFLYEVFTANRNLTFIDVGANVGYFSLMAAAAGVHVIAVEPIDENVSKLLVAVERNGFKDRVTVLQYAVSNNHKGCWLHVPGNNKGGGRIVLNQEWAIRDQGSSTIADSIVLDDITQFIQTKEVIIKLDIGMT